MAQRLKGKVALVTGASKGIGAAIAQMYASEGARVVVNCRSSEEAERRVVEGIKQGGGKALLVRADVSKTPDVKRMVSKAVGKFGRVDIMVNDAGILVDKDFLDSTEEDWDRVLDTNLKGAYLCAREVAPLMLTQKKGKIINISSNSGAYHPSAMRLVEYVTSKAGMNGLTKALALKLGPYVNVNAILPGRIETDMTAGASPELQRAVIEETPLKRLGAPEDVANAAVYLASDESDFVTGELHMVTGGRGMH